MVSMNVIGLLTAIMLASAPSIAMADRLCKSSAAAHLTVIADHVEQSIIEGDFQAAENAIVELQTAWIIAESDLRTVDEARWKIVDDAVFYAVATLQRPRPNRDAALKTAGSLLQAMARYCRS